MFMGMPMLVAVRMRVGDAVRMGVVVLVPMRAFMIVTVVALGMHVCVGRLMTVIVTGSMLMRMVMIAIGTICVELVHGVRMVVRFTMMQILDPLFALAAAAGAAHHTTSISLSRISSPP